MNQHLKELAYQALYESGVSTDNDQSVNQFIDRVTYLIGEEVLSLANRHGNIKPRRVQEYFGSDE